MFGTSPESSITRSCDLILFSFLSLGLQGIHADLLVILPQGRHVLTRLGELSLLHTLSHVPVDEGPLGVHQVEFVVKSSPGLSDGCGVGQHAHGSLHLGQVTARDDCGRLVVDANLETSGAPVDKLDAPLSLDGGDGSIDILGYDISPVEHAASHVLAVTRIALDHLVGGLETGVGDLGHGQLLVVRLLGRDDRGVGDQGEMDPWVGHQVGLELGQIHVESSIEAQRGGDRGDNLADQTVKVGVGGSVNVQITTANVVDSLIVDHEGTVRVFQCGVGSQDGVVRLHHGSGHLRGGVDGELELGLLAVVDRQPLHEEGGESRSSSTTEAVEDEESLKTGTLVGQLADSVQDQVDNLLADGVVAPGVVVGGVLLTRHHLLGVEQLAVGSSANLVNDSWLQIYKDSSRNVFASPGLREGVEAVVSSADGLVARNLAIRLDAVLHAVELPAGVA